MTEVCVKIPDDLGAEFRQLGKEEVREVVSKAIKERLSERLMFRVADELLKNSEVTDELASKWGKELKEAVAKRHGL